MSTPKPLGDVSHYLHGTRLATPESRTISPFPYLSQHVSYNDMHKGISSRDSWQVKSSLKDLPSRKNRSKMKGWEPIHQESMPSLINDLTMKE